MKILQISSTLLIPSLLCGFLARIFSLKNPDAESLYLIFGVSVCFLQTFLTIGAFQWLKTLPDEKTCSQSRGSVIVLIFVTWLFGCIGWYSGSVDVFGRLRP